MEGGGAGRYSRILIKTIEQFSVPSARPATVRRS